MKAIVLVVACAVAVARKFHHRQEDAKVLTVLGESKVR